MLGKRFWLRWMDGWVDVWTEVDHRKLTQIVILHRTDRGTELAHAQVLLMIQGGTVEGTQKLHILFQKTQQG